MNIVVLSAAGFIGTNLTLELAKESNNKVTLIDVNKDYFVKQVGNLSNVEIIESKFEVDTDYEALLKGQDIVYDLLSTTVPTTSNQHISQELMANVVVTSKIFDACVSVGVQRVIFLSSGGTVYGKMQECPIKEESITYPISSYGIQKITIEKLLFLYEYLYGLDYRVIRLANPYGPYQRPNGILGAVTTFTYKALKKEKIVVYGDGSVVRDFIYIKDAIEGILNIASSAAKYKIYNLGCGHGASLNEVLEEIQKVLGEKVAIEYQKGRSVDVPVNYLDVTRYESEFGKAENVPLAEGIKKLVDFMKVYYDV